MQIDRNENLKQAKTKAKRITITIFACIPVLILFGYFTRNIITNRAVNIICFVAIMGFAVLMEELIYNAIKKKKANSVVVETKKDVFK